MPTSVRAPRRQGQDDQRNGVQKFAARVGAGLAVGGVSIAQQLWDAGLVDELHVDLMPVFLGMGLRSFESSSLERVRLEKIDVQEVGARTGLRFRVKR